MQNHILDYLEASAARVPDKVAFSDENYRITFRALRSMACRVGTFLHRQGVYREPVAVFMDRSSLEIAAFLGVVAGGCFYVPVDAEMPKTRIRHIMESTKPRLILTDPGNYKAASAFGRAVRFEEASRCNPDMEALQEIHDHTIDTDPVYVVFTSGSTGVPKGVVACHRSVLDYAEQLTETLGFDRDTRFGCQSPLYVDACLKELCSTLKLGASTYLIPKDVFRYPVQLVRLLNKQKINTICWVSSALSMVSSLGTFRTVKPEYLRTVVFGSEVFPPKQLRLWRETLPYARFFNLYGPTEATGMSCCYCVDRDIPDDEPIPIGKPFKNTDILLLDEDNQRAAPGQTGELCIRGAALALGYYNSLGLSRQAFVQNPLNKAYPELIYRTGDLARYNSQGELVYVSRKDSQIKHMGYRIELGEIEAEALRADGVSLACCVYDGSTGRIGMYYTGIVEEKDLCSWLREALPHYMLPGRVLKLGQMPLTPNGKIDRTALTERFRQKRAG